METDYYFESIDFVADEETEVAELTDYRQEFLDFLNLSGMTFDEAQLFSASFEINSEEDVYAVVLWTDSLRPISLRFSQEKRFGSYADKVSLMVARTGSSNLRSCFGVWYPASYDTIETNRLISCTTQIVRDGQITLVREGISENAIPSEQDDVVIDYMSVDAKSSEDRGNPVWGPNFFAVPQEGSLSHRGKEGRCSTKFPMLIPTVQPANSETESLLVPVAQCVLLDPTSGVFGGKKPGIQVKTVPEINQLSEWVGVGGIFTYSNPSESIPYWIDGISAKHTYCNLPSEIFCIAPKLDLDSLAFLMF